MRARKHEGVGLRRSTAVQAACRGGLECRLGAGHREERTTNKRWPMLFFVTLEMSKLSGWLNADAFCRGSNRGHAMRGEGRARKHEGVGLRRATAVQAACRGGRGCRLGAEHGEERT